MRVAIIGAGLFGVSTAFYLAEDGHEVVVLEGRDRVADGCSRANGGIVHAGNAAPWSRPGVLRECLSGLGRHDAPLRVRPRALPAAWGWGMGFLRNSRRCQFETSLRVNAELAAYSLAELRALRRRLVLRYDAGSTGCMVLYARPKALQAAQREAAALAASGVRCERLHGDAIGDREPALRAAGRHYAGALYFPDDESGDACAFTRELATHAAARGAELQLSTTVQGLAVDGGRVTAVDTNRGRFHVDACVLAAGSDSPRLMQWLDLHLPIQPVKGHSISVPCTRSDALPRIPLIDTRRRIVLTVLGSQLRVAGFAELAGYDETPDPRRARALLDAATAWFPAALVDVDPASIEGWAGLRPTTVDGRPLLGATPIKGLFLATGAGHLGWTFAAGAGRFVADTVSGRCPALDPGGVSYGRFVT